MTTQYSIYSVVNLLSLGVDYMRVNFGEVYFIIVYISILKVF